MYPKKWDLYHKCNPIQKIFTIKLLQSSVLKPNLYPNMLFIPKFSLNLVNFLEISKVLALWDHVINFTQYTPKTVLHIHSIAQVLSRNWIAIERIPSTGIFAKWDIIWDVVQSLGHMTQGLEYDWPKEYVPQKMRFVPQNATQFNNFSRSNSYKIQFLNRTVINFTQYKAICPGVFTYNPLIIHL